MVSALILISAADSATTQPTPPDTCIKTWPVSYMNQRSDKNDNTIKLSGAVWSSRLENPLCPLLCSSTRDNNHLHTTIEMIKGGKYKKNGEMEAKQL